MENPRPKSHRKRLLRIFYFLFFMLVPWSNDFNNALGYSSRQKKFHQKKKKVNKNESGGATFRGGLLNVVKIKMSVGKRKEN